MKAQYHITIYLDTRRAKENGLFPVRLRVFTSNGRKKKYYPTVLEFTKEYFEKIWINPNPRTETKEDETKRGEIKAVQQEAIDVADKIKVFSLEQFEIDYLKFKEDKQKAKKILEGKNIDDVFHYFDETIQRKLDAGSISTAEKYKSAKISIQKFQYFKTCKKEDWSRKNEVYNAYAEKCVLSLSAITVDYLNEYQTYWLKKGKSKATLGINLRNLRTVYLKAIRAKAIDINNYPFGTKEDGKFEIPTSRRVNKALSLEDIKLLWSFEPLDEQQERAKYFWFFSYFTYGMNTKDVCQLKHTSIKGNMIYYVRAKTKSTKKIETKKEVPITENIKEIIEKYKVSNSVYLFGILNPKDNPKEEHLRIKKFNHFINTHFRKFAISAGIDKEFAEEIGTYHARHSFSQIASRRKGISIDLISEILHDGNLATTKLYLDSFPKEAYEKVSADMSL
jgi:integrase